MKLINIRTKSLKEHVRNFFVHDNRLKRSDLQEAREIHDDTFSADDIGFFISDVGMLYAEDNERN